MTAKEFTEMTGIGLDDEQMWCIHEVYMAGEQDKDYFCALVKTMYKADRCCIEYLLDLGRRLIQRRKAEAGRIKELEETVTDLQEFIYGQSDDPDVDVIRDKAIGIFGKNEFYARCLDNGRELGSEDMAYIAKVLREE